MFKRFFIFILVNILVISTIGIISSVFGLNHYITAQGMDYQSLLVICILWGFVGSFISLFMSKFMVKSLYGLKEIRPEDMNFGFIAQAVHNYSKVAGISKMPEVYIYDSPEVNAFATGPSKNNSLVAVSAGLINSMTREEVEGVIAHEVSHIANGDMVTMALAQGVINAFVMFLSRVAAFAISQALRKNDDDGPGLGPFAHMALTWVFDIVFGLLALPVLMWFSRYREFRADHGGAKLAGKNSMIAALKRLQHVHAPIDNRGSELAAFKISGSKKWIELLSSHPSLEKRIHALETSR